MGFMGPRCEEPITPGKLSSREGGGEVKKGRREEGENSKIECLVVCCLFRQFVAISSS